MLSTRRIPRLGYYFGYLLGIYLSGKPVFHIAKIPLDQSRLSSTSNAISQVVKWLFAATIGVATEKYQNNEDWPKLDAPLAAALSRFPRFRHGTVHLDWLFQRSSMILFIFLPGSIRVVTGGITQTCIVNSS